MQGIEKIFRIFADKNRIRILCLLKQRKMCVCELAYVLQVTQPSISRHLKKMKELELIRDEKDGFWTNYILCCDSDRTKELLKCLARWLKDDPVLKKDIVRLKTADRSRLCRN